MKTVVLLPVPSVHGTDISNNLQRKRTNKNKKYYPFPLKFSTLNSFQEKERELKKKIRQKI